MHLVRRSLKVDSALAVLALLGLAACNAKGTHAGAQGSFTMSIAPTRLELRAGGSEMLSLTVTRLNGLAGPIELAPGVLPPGVLVTGGPIAAGSSVGTLVVSVERTVPPQTFDVSLDAAAGGVHRQASFTLTVLEAEPGLPSEGVTAPGAAQVAGAAGNQVVVGEPVEAQVLGAGTAELRSGFFPSGSTAH